VQNIEVVLDVIFKISSSFDDVVKNSDGYVNIPSEENDISSVKSKVIFFIPVILIRALSEE
jgi:hypothetical protein